MIKKYTVQLGQVRNGNEVCENPIITLVGGTNVAINCIDEVNGIYEVQVDEDSVGACLEFLISCGDCHECPPIVVSKCFCDNNSDCDICETCGPDGFCIPKCPADQFCNDQGACVDCLGDDNCPGDLECINGRCQCPTGSTQVGNKCIECSDDSDCDICQVCSIDGKCIPKDCGDQVCDPDSGDCVECVNSGDCGLNEVCENNECVCAPGFIRRDGVCVAVECVRDEDCGDCQVCSSDVCIPKTCPPNQVPVLVAGVCQCVPECGDQGDCPDGTYCAPSEIPGRSGCIPCTGDCTNGCDFPCVCNQNLNQCVFDNCAGISCSDGTDCPDGCGCGLNGQCTSCSSLGCPGQNCEEVLGCGCAGSNCVDSDDIDDCAGSPCSVASDCGLGCTCDDGICVSCDNFSCAGNDCANREGCKCSGTNCIGDDVVCQETLELIKDDANCNLTGRLVKNQKCNCSQLTAAIDPKGGTINANDLIVNFDVQLRKGAYDGVSINSNPLLDDFTNNAIAENEPPTSGSIQLQVQARNQVFNITLDDNGQEVRTFVGSTLGQATTSNVTFPSSGDTATVSFVGISIPKIGTETRAGNTLEVVSSIELTFTQLSAVEFPNQCVYPAGTQIAKYTTNTDNELLSLPPRAVTIQSDSERLPRFTWYKSEDGNFNEQPFRKLYVQGSGNVFLDLLDDFTEDGLQACRNYLLESDCTCADPANKFVVFCNPEDIVYELEDCNTKFTLLAPFSPCQVNIDSGVEYRIKAGSIDITFPANNPPVNQSFVSTESITTIEYSIVCDSLQECTKTYTAIPPTVTPAATTSCQGDGTFDVSFATSGGTCGISKVEILGTDIELVSIFTRNLPAGAYTARVYFDCGCPPEEISFVQDCCQDFDLSPCYRQCDGTVVGCEMDPSATYTDGDLEITDLKGYVETAEPTTALSITVSRGACPSQQLNIPSQTESCCAGFGFTFTQSNPATSGVINIQNANVTTVSIASQGGGVPTPSLTKLDESTYLVSNLVEGEVYNVEVNDSICGTFSDTAVVTVCSLQLIGPGTDCVLKADTNGLDCQCNEVLNETEIVAVQNTQNGSQTQLALTLNHKYTGFDSEIELSNSTLSIIDKVSQFVYSTGNLPSADFETIPIFDLSLFEDTGYIDILVNTELVLTDGCVYSFSKDIRVFENLSSIPSGVISSVRPAINPSARKIKFMWAKDGAIPYTDYQDQVSVIPETLVVQGEVFYQHGSNYAVSASCPPCEENLNFQFCCEPTIEAEFNECNKRVIFTLTGKPGSYTVVYGQAAGIINIIQGETSGTVSIFNDNGHTANSVSISLVGKLGCEYTFPVNLQSECLPEISTSACTADKYDITILNCGNVDIEVNGTPFDSINGNQILGVQKGSGIQFTVTDPQTGCTYLYEAGQDFQDPCLPICPGNAYSSSPLQYVIGSCIGSTYNNDGRIDVMFFGDGTEDRYGVSSALASQNDPYDGPDYASATAVPGVAPYTALIGTAEAGGVYKVRFYQGDPDCFTDVIITIPAVDCNCPTNTYTVTPTPATCTGLTSNNDGQITLSSIVGGSHVGISSEGATMYDGPTTIAGATVITASPFTVKGDVPNTGGTYIVRVFAGNDGCYLDTNVVVDANVCVCTGPNTASIAAFSNDPTCTGSNPDNNGSVGFVSSDPQADRYIIQAGSSITGSPSYATATPLPAPSGNTYTLQDNISNAGGVFTFRLYAGNDDCFQDYTETVAQVICSNPCNDECIGAANGTPCTQGPYASCQNEICVIDCNQDPFGCYIQLPDGNGCFECQINNGLNCTTALGDPGRCTATEGTCVAIDDGACCLPGGNCEFRSEGSCNILGGTFQGAGVTCAQVNCPGGAQNFVCCLPDNTCNTSFTEGQCFAIPGASGATSCALCPSPEPDVNCCSPSGQCTVVPLSQCNAPNTTVANCSQCQPVNICDQACIGQADFTEGCNGPGSFCLNDECVIGPVLDPAGQLNDCVGYNYPCREPGVDGNGCEQCVPKAAGVPGGFTTDCDGNGNEIPTTSPIGCCTFQSGGFTISQENVSENYCTTILGGTYSPGSCAGACCNLSNDTCTVTSVQSCQGINVQFLGPGSNCNQCPIL